MFCQEIDINGFSDKNGQILKNILRQNADESEEQEEETKEMELNIRGSSEHKSSLNESSMEMAQHQVSSQIQRKPMSDFDCDISDPELCDEEELTLREQFEKFMESHDVKPQKKGYSLRPRMPIIRENQDESLGSNLSHRAMII